MFIEHLLGFFIKLSYCTGEAFFLRKMHYEFAYVRCWQLPLDMTFPAKVGNYQRQRRNYAKGKVIQPNKFCRKKDSTSSPEDCKGCR